MIVLQRKFSSRSVAGSQGERAEHAEASWVWADSTLWSTHSIWYCTHPLQFQYTSLSIHTLNVCNSGLISLVYGLWSHAEEISAAKQSELNLLTDEVDRAQARLLSLEREKVIYTLFYTHCQFPWECKTWAWTSFLVFTSVISPHAPNVFVYPLLIGARN